MVSTRERRRTLINASGLPPTMRWLILFLLLVAPVSAATLSGIVYTQDLQIAKYALVSINTTPQQRILLVDGT